MYQCPNCNGNLKFYIPSQMLRCDFCQTELDPSAFQKDKDASEETFFETTVFTCPQCGGELISEDNEATAFCSFCGASNILDSRISKEKRPEHILPFQKTKEDCKKAYSSMMKRALFAPSQLKNEKYIDSFRGIYMPYWVYHINQSGPVMLNAKKTYRKGNYIITDYYHLNFDLDADYDGLSRDASSSFDDNLSEALAPYHIVKAKPFMPSYLSGFYADTADVKMDLYQSDVASIAAEATMKQVKKCPAFFGYELSLSDSQAASSLNSSLSSVSNAMFPVWFLSYRNGDRVAYATVNGQTGKVAADIPVDPKKYLLGSILLAIPFFLLLNFLLTITPTLILVFSSLFASLSLILYSSELTQIIRKDSSLDDKGALSRMTDSDLDDKVALSQMMDSQQSKLRVYSKSSTKPKKPKKPKTKQDTKGVLAVMFFLAVLFMSMANDIPIMYSYSLWCILSLVVGIIYFCIGHKKLREISIQKKRHRYIGSLAALILAVLIAIVNPVSDIYFYIGSVAVILAVFFTISDLIYYYNILSTRQLPQFNRKGGDDRA